MFKKTLHKHQNHSYVKKQGNNLNGKHKSTLRQMMELTNQQNLIQNIACQQSKNINKKIVGSSLKKEELFYQTKKCQNDKVYTLRMQQISNNIDVRGFEKGQISYFNSDSKIKPHSLLQAKMKSISKNSFNDLSEQNLYQILDYHIQRKPMMQNDTSIQYMMGQENDDEEQLPTKENSNQFYYLDSKITPQKKRIPLLKINEHQLNNGIAIQRRTISPLPTKNKNSWGNSRQINLSPLRRPNDRQKNYDKKDQKQNVRNNHHGLINKNRGKFNKEESLNFDLFSSKQLTFKALQKNPTKNFRFSQLARQFVRSQRKTCEIQNLEHQDGNGIAFQQRSSYGDGKNYLLQEQRSIFQKSSFNMRSLKEEKETKNSKNQMKTPNKNNKVKCGNNQNFLHRVHCQEKYEYQFPQNYSPSPNRSRNGTPGKSRFHQTSHSHDKIVKMHNHISTLQESLKNFQIPVEYRNQVTKTEYDKLNKEFQKLKSFIILKIEEQILKKNSSLKSGLGANGTYKFSVQNLVQTLNETISKTFSSYGQNNKEAQNMLKMSIQQSLRNFTCQYDQIIHENDQNNGRQLKKERNANLFSFEGTNQLIWSEEQAEKYQQQIENEGLEDNALESKGGQDIVKQQNGKQQNKASEKIECQLPMIGFDADSSLSSMGIPALIESLQVPQSKSGVRSNGAFNFTKSSCEQSSYFKRIPLVNSQNGVSLANTIKNKLDLESVEECPNNQNQFGGQIQQAISQQSDQSCVDNPNNVIVSVQPFGIHSQNSGQNIPPLPLKQEPKKQSAGLAFKKKQLKPCPQNKFSRHNQAKQTQQYQIQSKIGQTYEVRYALKFLDKKTDHTEVVRVSPIKMRKNQEIMQNLVLKKIVKKESNSIVYE